MNIAAIISSLKQAMEIKDLVSCFIVPINNFSINYINTFTIEEIKELNKIKPVFTIINKNIHNSELDDLKKILQEIEKIDISGIFFYDISLINLKNKLNLKTPLVWAQEHLTTNYQTINYWFNKGVKYVYLSSELTKNEIDEIKEKSKAKVFVNVFGHIPMFTSRRHLVKNYLQHFSLKDENKNKKIYKENKYYPIFDNQNGTTVYSDYILNILDEDLSKYDYIVFNSNFINGEAFYDTLVKYNEKKEEYKFPYEHGFLYKETIYRVKEHE